MARSSLTPDQLLRIFDEAPSSNVLVSEYISVLMTFHRDFAASFPGHKLIFSFDRSDKVLVIFIEDTHIHVNVKA